MHDDVGRANFACFLRDIGNLSKGYFILSIVSKIAPKHLSREFLQEDWVSTLHIENKVKYIVYL